MKIKKIFFPIIIFLSVYSSIFPQPKDVIYIDFGALIAGTAATIGIGINYERMLNNNISLRTGINFVSQEGRFTRNLMIGTPVSANFFTSADNRIEGGIGSGIAFNVKGFVTKNMFPGATFRFGYRYQKRDVEGKFVKVGLEFPSNLYFSLVGIGYSR